MQNVHLEPCEMRCAKIFVQNYPHHHRCTDCVAPSVAKRCCGEHCCVQNGGPPNLHVQKMPPPPPLFCSHGSRIDTAEEAAGVWHLFTNCFQFTLRDSVTRFSTLVIYKKNSTWAHIKTKITERRKINS